MRFRRGSPVGVLIPRKLRRRAASSQSIASTRILSSARRASMASNTDGFGDGLTSSFICGIGYHESARMEDEAP